MSITLAQARLRACQHWPFASHAILSMVPVPRPGLGTLAVDKHWRLYFDEAALERFGTERAAGLILHEVDHLLKRHHKRGGQLVGDDRAKWDTWNTATDASINGGLRSEGIPLPDGGVYPEQFDLPEGLSAEEYFRELTKPKDEPETPEETPDEDSEPEQHDDSDQEDDHEPSEDGETPEDSQEPDGEDNDSGSGTDAQGESDPGHEGTPSGPGEDAGDGGGDDHGTEEGSGGTEADAEVTPQPVGTSGSCSDGRPRPWELGEPDDDSPGLDEADQEALIRVAAKNAVDKDRGKGTGGHRRWAEEILNPPVDPAAKLLHLVRRSCDVTVGVGDRSYRRPSRRNANPRMVLPTNVAPLPRITVIVDTSGSMDQQDLGLALGMIRKVLFSFRIRDGIKVITGDARGQTKQLCLSDPRRIELTGGGGTNMAAIIAEALQERPTPQMIIVCTDGWTPWPEEDPGIPVVACLSRRVTSLLEEYRPPNWITTVELR